MGCFNSSGFISKLPIRYGDRVVCFIATENPNASIRNLYIPDCQLVPWGIPVRGKYDDYGSIEDVDEDYNTDLLCRLFKVDKVEEIFKAVERCIYGESLDENIKYWKHDKENVKKYKMLEVMYGNIKEYMKHMNAMVGGKKRPVQPMCTLMFEHEAVYDFVTQRDVNDGWHTEDFSTALDEHVRLMRAEMKLDCLFDEYNGETDDDKRNAAVRKTFFDKRFDSFDSYEFTAERIIGNETEKSDPSKADVLERLKKAYEAYNKAKETEPVYWGGEGRSPMFMMQLKFMKPETYVRFFEEKRDELLRFCRLMRYMAYAPLKFECSITAGQQQYNAGGFVELYDYLHTFSEKLFEYDLLEESEEDNE